MTFYSFLELLRTASKDQKHASLWMLTAAGDAVFKAAKERMYRIVQLSSDAEVTAFSGPTVVDKKAGACVAAVCLCLEIGVMVACSWPQMAPCSTTA